MKQSFNGQDAVVLFSGGQDSTTCLVWALRNFRFIRAISYFYNQKHAVELEAARAICGKLGVELKNVDISFMGGLVVSDLFQGGGDLAARHAQQANVPSSFVPYRNLLFLTLAAAWAGTVGARHLVTGVCETDYSGYADCRDAFIKSTQATLNLATDFAERSVVIHTPLMWLTKAEEFRMAEELGCLELVLRDTVTCYNGDPTPRDWGQGCGECPSCQLRRRGWEEYRKTYMVESSARRTE